MAGPPSSGRPSPSTTRPRSARPARTWSGPPVASTSSSGPTPASAPSGMPMASPRSKPTTSHARGLAAAANGHDVAHAHARHDEPETQPRDAEHAARRSNGRRSGEPRLEGLDVQERRSPTWRRRRAWPMQRRPRARPTARTSSSRARALSAVGTSTCDHDDQRSAPPAVEPWDASALQREERAGLRSRRDRQRHRRFLRLGLQSGHPDLGAERRVGERHVHPRHQVHAVALEPRVALDVDLDVQVSGRRTPGSRHSLPRHAQSLAAVDARGEGHGDLARPLDGPLPRARGAGVLDHPPRAPAARASRREHDEAARVRDLPGPSALRAGLGLACPPWRPCRRSPCSAWGRERRPRACSRTRPPGA